MSRKYAKKQYTQSKHAGSYSQGRVSDTEGCQGKKTFSSESRANNALNGIALRNEGRSDRTRKEVRSYECKHCFGYHLTSQRSGLEERRDLADLEESLMNFKV